MIILTLLGGLGNQMFQYALGRSLSIKLKSELVLDLSSYGDDPLRSYQLNYFPIRARTSTKEDLSRVIPSEGIRRIIKARVRLLMQNKNPIIIYKEKRFNFDPDIFKIPDDSSLFGFWQNEKYFSDISHIIRSDFLFPTSISPKNDQILKRIKKTTSVSIHIRHGDYITNPTANSYHGVCSKDYYQTAMKMIEERINEPEYFIFTDDPEWARKNIHTLRPKNIIDWNQSTPHEDLRLMTSCKHHIIANSSFSWWGAWLGKKDHQTVIAPEPWFDTTEHYTQDIYGEKWIRIAKNDPSFLD